MKDILRMMRFDFLTAAPVTLTPLIVIVLAMTLISLLVFPGAAAFILLGALLFILPQGTAAEKSDFGKLYGILPVARKNITRGRFLFIFVCTFAAEVFALLLIWLSMQLQLNSLLPNQDAEFMQIAAQSFDRSKFINYGMTVGAFTVACLAFSFMEMTGQIFGRESDIKVIFIVMGIITVIAVAFSILSDRGVIPGINLNAVGETFNRFRYPISIGMNIGGLALCILFGEITANKLAAREL